MKYKANIGPYTNFKEIFTYLKCPARLYLKLIGCKSEVERVYTPPEVSPAILGEEGEKRIEQGFKREFDTIVPQREFDTIVPHLAVKKICLPKSRLEKILTRIRKIIASNINTKLSRIQDIEVKSRPLVLSEEAKKLKRDFKVAAIISKVDFTTVPHHRVGEIDFIGLKEDREVTVIEVKNKKDKLDERDKLQLEYYIDGISKQYHYTKFYMHLHEIASQLYPNKYRNFIKLAESIDLLEEEIQNSQNIVKEAISNLGDEEKEKFLSIYKPKKETVFEQEYEGQLLFLEDAVEEFLMTIPEYVRLKNTFNRYSKKVKLSIDEFESAADFIAELMEKGVRNGILVDIRRSRVEEVDRKTNFDELVRGVWQVKKSAFEGKRIAPKRTDECRYCHYKNACRKLLKDEEMGECKSITSIVHRGFKKLNVEVNEPSFELYPYEIRYLPPAVISELSIEELLKSSLAGTEWEYISDLAKKLGWTQLYADAVVSRKLGKEFDFWRL